MGRSISPQIERKIWFLFSIGITRRRIAAFAGASPGGVISVLSRPMTRKTRPPDFVTHSVKPYLCECGYIVHLSPCVICAASK